MKKGSSSPAGFFLKALKITVAILMLNVEKYLFYNCAIYIIISSSIETVELEDGRFTKPSCFMSKNSLIVGKEIYLVCKYINSASEEKIGLNTGTLR